MKPSRSACHKGCWNREVAGRAWPTQRSWGRRPLRGPRTNAAQAPRPTSQPNNVRHMDVPLDINTGWEPQADAATHISASEIRDYLSGYDSQPYEYDYYVDKQWLEGKLPAELQGGTLLAAGPGLTRAYGSRVRCPSDGDGMLWSLAVAPPPNSKGSSSGGGGGDNSKAAPGRIFFRNRFVRTPSFAAEQLAGRRLSRGFHDRGAPLSDGSALSLPEPLQELLMRVQAGLESANAKPVTPVPGSQKGADASNWGSGFWDDGLERLMSLAGQVSAGVLGGAGPVGPLFNPLDLSFRATGGSGVLYWAGSLFALSEHAPPREMNKLTLETVAVSDMWGALAGTPNLAAWKVCPPPGSMASPDGFPSVSGGPASQARRLALMCSQQSGTATVLHFKELDAAGKVVSATKHTLESCVARLISDFLVTEHFYIVVQAPLSLNLERMATRYTIGDASFAECIDFLPGASAKMHFIPRGRTSADKGGARPGGKDGAVIELPAMVAPRLIQAAELGYGSDQVWLCE